MLIEKKIYSKNKTLKSHFVNIINILENVWLEVLLLFVRLWIARIFWLSGLSKISDWPGTLYLFAYEYKVPIISTKVAAYLSTSTELITPVLLTFGFMTRIACIPMFMMVLVIQYTYLYRIEHIYWMTLILLLICKGPGKLSLDYLIRKKFI
jgi:putative oxidoreductase